MSAGRGSIPYRVEGTLFRDREEPHFEHQPFRQVPWLMDGAASIFESGAILLHLGERSEALMPSDPDKRIEVKEWLFSALNSVEMASLPWSILSSADKRVCPWTPSGSLVWSGCWRHANG